MRHSLPHAMIGVNESACASSTKLPANSSGSAAFASASLMPSLTFSILPNVAAGFLPNAAAVVFVFSLYVEGGSSRGASTAFGSVFGSSFSLLHPARTATTRTRCFMRRMVASRAMRVLVACCILVPALASAETDFSHHKQFQLSARVPFGIRGIATYDDEFCGDTDSTRPSGFAKVCTGRTPLAIDFEFGYGIKRAIDLIVELRIGIEQDFGATASADDGPRPFHLSPGGRFFFSEGARSKLFTTAQLVIDFAGYEDPAGESLGTDFGVRNMSGLWIDLDRAYGFYAYVGSTATFARWLRFELEAGIGIQGRY